MRQYKDSGIEWIGKIPETWEVMQIRRVMRNRSERNQPDAMVLSLYRDLGIVPKESRDDNHNVTSEDTANYKVVSKGNFVINKMKAWQGSMAVSEYDGIVSPAYYVCSFTREVCKKYVHYLLRDASYKPEYLRLSTGMRIGQWDLNIEDFLRIKTILPPVEEQQCIADYLDLKCGEIDSLIALQEQMIEKLKAYRQSVITEAVTKGLDPNAKLVPSGIDWIGEIPEGWKVMRIKNVTSNYKAGPFGSALITGNLLHEGKILVYTPEHVADSSKIFHNTNNLFLQEERRIEMSQFFVKAGDVVFPIVGSLGRALVIEEKMPEGIINQRLSKFSIDRNLIDESYFMWLFGKSSFYAKYIEMNCRGSFIVNLTKVIVGDMPLPTPPLSEQHAIAAYLDEKCADIDRLIALKQQKIEKLKDYKKSVIYEAVTGKTSIE